MEEASTILIGLLGLSALLVPVLLHISCEPSSASEQRLVVPSQQRAAARPRR